MRIRDGFHFGVGLALAFVTYKFVMLVLWILAVRAAGMFVGFMPL